MYEDCSVDQATLGHKASWPVGESNTHTGAHTHTRTHTHTHSSGHRTTGRQLHPHASVERTDTRHPLANDLVFFFSFLVPFLLSLYFSSVSSCSSILQCYSNLFASSPLQSKVCICISSTSSAAVVDSKVTTRYILDFSCFNSRFFFGLLFIRMPAVLGVCDDWRTSAAFQLWNS